MKARFIVIVQNTYSKAARTLENIKSEFKDNERLIKATRIKLTKESEGDSIFRHTNGYETRVLCKGSEQIGSIRGEKFGAYRPDLIIVDDLEDDDMVKNPDRRVDLKNLYDNALVPAGEQGKCRFVIDGTILHDDSLLAKLVSPSYYPEYKKLLYRARNEVNGKFVSLWDSKWTVKHLNWMEKNKPDVFAKELQNDPVAGSLQRFHAKDFRYWKIENLDAVIFNEDGSIWSRYKLSDCKGAIAVDLAWEMKRQSDYSVIMPGFLTPNSDLLVDTYIHKQGLREDEFIQTIYTLVERMKALTQGPVPVGFEKAKLEKVMKHLLSKQMRKDNKAIWMKDLVWDGDKITRIETRLLARYKMHMIYHKQGMGDLEHQLTRFPSASHDDLPDALQGLVQLLEFPKHGRRIESKEDEFMWWRRKSIEARKYTPKRYYFGVKGKKRWIVPAQESYR